jgi:dolichol-phosphate mannosyltransferase
MSVVSILTPAYNEELNLRPLYEAVVEASKDFGCSFEWIIVDDHSADRTFEVAAGIAATDPRVHVIRLSRNAGSHNALFCAFEHTRGDCAAILAADLQDPPETISALIARWREGAQVVWAARASAPQVSSFDRIFARLYWWMTRKWLGLEDTAPTGADMVLLDAVVVKALSQFAERSVSIFALLTWMGFRQTTITYEKQHRLHGHSGWTARKKLKLVVDSVVSFSFLPVRLFSALGILSALLGFLYAVFIIIRTLTHATPVEGWSSLMVVVLLIGGLQLLMLGVLGEYLWRALQETRARPRYLIEATTGGPYATGARAGSRVSRCAALPATERFPNDGQPQSEGTDEP